MSQIFATIQADYLAARKQAAQSGDDVARSLLSTLVGKITIRAKDDNNRAVTDADVEKCVKFYVDGATETLGHRPGDEVAAKELAILKKYQDLILASKPPQLSVEQMIAIIRAHAFANMGDFMKHLKMHHAGQFEGAAAKEAFNSK